FWASSSVDSARWIAESRLRVLSTPSFLRIRLILAVSVSASLIRLSYLSILESWANDCSIPKQNNRDQAPYFKNSKHATLMIYSEHSTVNRLFDLGINGGR